jgi:hypothetical protein
MSDKLHPYSYTIITKQGITKTNRMKNAFQLFATKELLGRRTLSFKFPGCKIIHIKPKGDKIISTTMVADIDIY